LLSDDFNDVLIKSTDNGGNSTVAERPLLNRKVGCSTTTTEWIAVALLE